MSTNWLYAAKKGFLSGECQTGQTLPIRCRTLAAEFKILPNKRTK